MKIRLLATCTVVTGLLLTACGPPETPTTKIGCWVTEVVSFSSEGSASDYSASQLLGKADIHAVLNPEEDPATAWMAWDEAPYCSDNAVAWSPAEQNAGVESLTLKFESPIQVDRVRVFENFGPGAAKVVTLVNTEDDSAPTLQYAVPGELQGPGQSCGVLDVDVDMADGFEFSRDTYNQVQIDFDTTQVTGWNEVDAVMLAGQIVGGGSGPESCEAYEFVPEPTE